MSVDRVTMRRSAIALLDELATVHPSGHQPIKTQRYVLTSSRGALIDIMFEKDADSPPNLWVLAKAAGPDLISHVKGKPSPASRLWKKIGADGKPQYGRHSSLKDMPQLIEADLHYFELKSFEQFGLILDRLLSVEPADLF